MELDCTVGWGGNTDFHGYDVYVRYHLSDSLRKSQSIAVTSKIVPSVRLQEVTRTLLNYPFTPTGGKTGQPQMYQLLVFRP